MCYHLVGMKVPAVYSAFCGTALDEEHSDSLVKVESRFLILPLLAWVTVGTSVMFGWSRVVIVSKSSILLPFPASWLERQRFYWGFSMSVLICSLGLQASSAPSLICETKRKPGKLTFMSFF